MEVDIIITVALAVVIIFVVNQIGQTIRAAALHKTLRQKIEQGQPLSAEILDRLDRVREPGAIEQRNGFVLIALALALFAAGLINPGEDNTKQLTTIALFPLFVGGALLLRLWLAARARAEP